MTLNPSNFNIRELIDSQQLTDAIAATLNPANRVANREASHMLDILRELHTDMQSMSGRISNLEQSRETREPETASLTIRLQDGPTTWTG